MNSAASATRSQTESKNAPRGPARPLWRATEPSRMSGNPVRITPNTPSSRWPSAISNAVPMANTRPMMVRLSAVIPARCRPWPTGSSPRSTVARQRPSSMCRGPRSAGRAGGAVEIRLTPVARRPGPGRDGSGRAPDIADSDVRRLASHRTVLCTGGCRWRPRRSRRRRSATWPWSVTGARGRPPWPRPSSTTPAPSAAWAGSRTAPPSPTSTPRKPGGASRCRWRWPPSSTTVTRST